MGSRRSLRALCAVLLLTVVAAQPVAAAPSVDEGREWFGALETWWGQLIERFGVVGAASSDGSGGDDGPTIDPLGVSAPAQEEGDTGPTIDPAGGSAPAQDEGDGGPDIDPLG